MNMAEENAKTAQPTIVEHHPHGVYEDFDTYLINREVALTNAADAVIAPLLTAAGYPPTVIAAKKVEFNALRNLGTLQKKEYGEQYEATKDFNELASSLHPTYLKHVNYGKLIFKEDKAAMNVLDLNGRRKQAEGNYIEQALKFYEGSLAKPEYKTLLAARGITEAALTAGKNGYTTLKGMISIKETESGEAQMATAERDIAWENFDEWFVEFKKYATLALSVTPQLREKLGWKE
jgi:hypothetical protein